MIHSVFELGDTLVREVMVPRTDMVCIERHKTLRQAMSLALRSGLSRIPVIGEDHDDVVGVVYLKDVVSRIFDTGTRPRRPSAIESVMRPAHVRARLQAVDELLREMQAQRDPLAIVVDEYGGTAGLVTIEDILEEIVGEITDEYDQAERRRSSSSPAAATGSAPGFHVDDLGELFGVAIDDEDVDTVGGLIAKHLGRVPIAGSVVEAHGLRLEAEGPAGRRNRIGTVVVTRLDARPEDTAEPHDSYSDSHA